MPADFLGGTASWQSYTQNFGPGVAHVDFTVTQAFRWSDPTLSPVHPNVGQRLEPTPEDLGHQMVLRREIGVGGGRGHPGPAGDVAHGEAFVAVGPDLVHGGVGQALHGVGLALAEVAAHGLDGEGCRVAGHLSGH